MKTIGNILLVGTEWKIQKLIPEGRTTPKWGVWKNSRHIGSELTKRRAIAVIEWWPHDPPTR